MPKGVERFSMKLVYVSMPCMLLLKAIGFFEKGVSYDNNGPKGLQPTIRDAFGTGPESARFRSGRGVGERNTARHRERGGAVAATPSRLLADNA